jgi:hypothetical protein
MDETPENSTEPEVNDLASVVEFVEPQIVEKKKRVMTPAQLANLEKMRHKKAVKTEAKKLIQSDIADGKISNANFLTPQTFVGANGSNELLQVRQKYEQDLEEVREIKNYLKDYFAYKQEKNDLKKKRNASPEPQYYMEYKVKI